MPFDFKKLNFGGLTKIDPSETILDHLEHVEQTPAADKSESEIQQTTGNIVLCQNCKENERKSSQSFLCSECESKRNGTIAPPERKSVVEITPSANIEGNSLNNVRQLEFAPVSVRYSGKDLDAIAWAMMPSLPEELLLQIRAKAIEVSRANLTTNPEPTIQDLDAIAEFHRFMYEFHKALSAREKEKLLLKAKPELARREKERKEAEKTKKIQSSVPKDVVSKHTANVVLKDLAEITAAVDKSHQTLLKKFLDYVSLQMQAEDEINVEWLERQLQKQMYTPLRPYFKIKKSA